MTLRGFDRSRLSFPLLRLCAHKFTSHIKRQLTVITRAQYSEHRLFEPGFDEIAQPSAAMPRGSGDPECLNRLVRNEGGRSSNVAPRNCGNDGFLIDRNAGALDVRSKKLVAH